MPCKPTRAGGQERTIRITGTKTTHRSIIETLSDARGVKYTVQYRDPAEAAVEEEKVRVDGNTLEEVMWLIRPLISSGYGVADGTPGSKLDNDLLDSVSYGMKEPFTRMYGRPLV